MTQEEIIEGNKLIAEFMVFDYERSIYGHGGTLIMTLGIENCLYHSSWDWLMPVVEKIRSLNNMVNINFWSEQNTVECKIYRWELGAEEIVHECENAIESVYQAVIEFIKWHKTQPNER